MPLRVGFIGLGAMGLPMALNVLDEGHVVKAFDVVSSAVDAAVAKGCTAAASPRDAATGGARS